MDGTYYVFSLPTTAGYGAKPEHFKYIIGDLGVELKKGEHEITIKALDGNRNYDYLGLVKHN